MRNLLFLATIMLMAASCVFPPMDQDAGSKYLESNILFKDCTDFKTIRINSPDQIKFYYLVSGNCNGKHTEATVQCGRLPSGCSEPEAYTYPENMYCELE